jgi:putative ABC transport system permease protein
MTPFLFKLTWANLAARPMATFLTVATLAAAVSLISLLIQFSAHIDERLSRDVAGVDLVVGAKGSPLQLILSSLLHIDIPTGNIPLSEAQGVMRHPQAAMAVPLALGDSFRGFRIVGTDAEFLELYQAEFAAGNVWSKTQQVVIGAQVAKQLGMNLGQRFIGGHGLSYSGIDLTQHDHAVYEVVGILKPKASIIDRLIVTSVDSVWHAHEEAGVEEGTSEEDHHELEAHSKLSNLRTMKSGGKAITALLIKYRSPIAAVSMPRAINERAGLQAASPALEITRLYNLSAGLVDAGRVLAAIMMVIGGLSIFVAVSSAAVQKVYDIALLRSMGAKPISVFLQQLYEGLVVAVVSGLLGIGLAHAFLLLAASVYTPLLVFGLTGTNFFIAEAYLLLATMVIGIFAVIWPALSSYKVDPMMLLKRGR